MISIGIAGTAKNTGKTTTLQALLQEAQRSEQRLGITSIGYDGEWKDNITGLPKPRIHVQEGTLVGVAAACVPASTCRIRILANTGISTALGEVLVGEVIEPGLLITAGPNKIKDLRILQDHLQQWNCQLLFVDGALNRIIPFSLTDGMILATGAARNPDIEALAKDASLFDCILRFPYRNWGSIKRMDSQHVQQVAKDDQRHSFAFRSLMTVQQAMQVATTVRKDTEVIHIPGAIQTDALWCLIEELLQLDTRPCIHITTPLQLIPGSDLERMCQILYRWLNAGGQWSVGRPVPLLAMTVNPFYPAFRFSSTIYENAYVDKQELLAAMRTRVGVPVYDIRTEGSEALWNILVQKYLGN